jgi:lipopolysaccharide transport system ATP-binding protein
MSDVIIRVENLGKKYSLRRQGDGRYTALRDVLTDKAKALLRQHAMRDLPLNGERTNLWTR